MKMDFYQIRDRTNKKGSREVYPEFKVCRSKDLMVRGKSFYAIWDQEKGMWSTDEYDVQRLVDDDLRAYRQKLDTEDMVGVQYMANFSSNSWLSFRNYISHVSDNAHQLDERLTFSNTQVDKKDYVSHRLPYPLEAGEHTAFDELMGTLYSEEELAKILWAIGAIVEGDSRDIQKFLVFYGEAGAGKSTVLNIIQKLFEGYFVMFDAKALTSNNNAFATEVFRTNPLVAIQHDGDLSRIEDNTKLNSIVSHEMMVMNEKYKSSYTARANCFLFMATNKPVKITDAKSGIIRRLIDVKPSGKRIPPRRYQTLMNRINFELGAIAEYCRQVYLEMGKHYYDPYRPVDMMYKTDEFFNFVEDSYMAFSEQEGVSLKNAYTMYKQYCEESGAQYKLQMYKFREELKNYFRNFDDMVRIDGKQVRSWYSGFMAEKFDRNTEAKAVDLPAKLTLEDANSLLDDLLRNCPAQYASANETPLAKWAEVKTTLRDLDTRKLHYVKPPLNHIVIDFDLKDEEGLKSAKLNLEAAAKWPPTYAEFSKGGQGVHLHYIYDGDVSALSSVYAPGIEVKTFSGNGSLRRRFSFCNGVPVATISSGLPTKEVKVINHEAVKSEKALRELIARNLRKEIHPGTKPSIDFIEKILSDAYEQGLHYDVSDLKSKVLAFANHSTHKPEYCIKAVGRMKFRSEDASASPESYRDERLIFFDCEVFPNLLLVNWKYEGPDQRCVRMINPKPQDIEELFRFRLVGFNCRRYDNHILYACYLGKTNEEIYEISQKIISGSRNAMYGEAYNISYTDVYDFCSTKQSLKKWEIELGIHHQELGIPWDQPVPKERWEQVAKYCDNDVIATEAVFHARQSDWTARKILADVAELTVNDTTNSLTTRIIFGKNRALQDSFNYRNLGDASQIVQTYEDAFTAFDEAGRPIFPGYAFENGKSLYRGEEVGEGGYVYAEPGIHRQVALLDIASMHPSSIVAEQLFGETYTSRFQDILEARIAIKHKDFEKARKLLDGKLAPYLTDESKADDLAQALKIAINSVYGLTSARFENPFRDPRNADNIVAKRGALFMVNLKHLVQEKGFTVAHIKTDSIKIPNATPEIIQFVMDYGKRYGYNFEHEATYDRMCLVNDAVYIAKYNDHGIINKGGKHAGEWTATGAQFQVPYVFKTLFSREPIGFADLCETKAVTSALYLDMNENLPDVSAKEKELEKLTKQMQKEAVPMDESLARAEKLKEEIAKGHNYIFIGKTGLFCPMKAGHGGGLLMREKDGKYYSVSGTKGYRWLESEVVKGLEKENEIDRVYFDELVDDAKAAIDQYEDFEAFRYDDREPEPAADLPWGNVPCGEAKYQTCFDCPHYHPIDSQDEKELYAMSCDQGYADILKGEII